MDSDKRVSSRLIKQERKKITRQIMWFVTIAIVLVLGFIFIVLPLFIRFVNDVLNSNPIEEEDTIILQSPVLSAPVEATNSAQFKIDGFADPQEEVVVILNGEEHTRTATRDDGSFTAELVLTEGENGFTTYAIDSEMRESKTGQEYRVTLDTEKPLLEIAEPEEGKEFGSKDKMISVTGKTDKGAKVYVNDRLVFPDSEGSFKSQFSLQNGENEIKIKAVDEAGNETEQARKVKLNG